MTPTDHPHLALVRKQQIQSELELWAAIERQSDFLQRHELLLAKTLRRVTLQSIVGGIGALILLGMQFAMLVK